MTTVLGDEITDIEATVEGDAVLVTPETLEATLGWSLRPEGLCRGDVCVPVPETARLSRAGGVDLNAAANLLGRQTVVDGELGVVAIAVEPARRHRAIRDLDAPEFTLPDTDGTPRSLSDWRGRKRLLVAFASW